MPNRFEQKYGGVTAAPVAAPAGPLPSFQTGPSASQLADDRRADDAAAREAERLRIAREEADRKRRDDEQKGGLPDATEYQNKSLNFLGKGLTALEEYEARGVGPRSMVGQTFQQKFPTAANELDDPSRQVAQAAQEAFVKAVLRPESGAVIGPEEMQSYIRDYFPVPGASPEEIAFKRKMRLTAMRGLYDSGQLAMTPEQRAAYKGQLDRIEAMGSAAGNGAGGAQSGGDGPLGKYDLANAKRLPDGRYELTWGDGRKEVADSIPMAVNVEGTTDGPDLGRAFHMGVGDVAEAVGDTLGIITNPVNTGINALFGTEIGTDLGQSFRDFTGAPEARTDSEKMISAINKGGTSALTFGGLARGAAPFLEGGARSVANVLGGNLATDTITGSTSALGGEYARQKGGGTGAQLAASVLGGGVGLTAAGIGSQLANRAARTPSLPPLARIGKEEGVEVRRAMVEPALQNRVTGVEATMAGGPIIQRALGDTAGQIGRGVLRLGAHGEAMNPNVAGQSIRDASDRFIKTSGAAARRAYDKAEQLAGNIQLDATSARTQADEMIARLSETANTNAKEIAYLTGLRDDLSKPISVGALRDLRTTLRKQISKGELTFGQNEQRVLGIMDSLADDINAGLVANGRADAARQFARADKAYRDRMDVIGSTIQKLVGKRDSNRTPEAIYANFRSMASPKGDEKGFAEMLNIMKPDERADIAATFADELGKNRDGKFSTAFLVSQAEKLPAAARRNVFGEEGAKSLENLVTLAREHKRVVGGLNNSRTGVANDWRSLLGSLVFGGGSGLGVGVATGSTTAGLGTGALALAGTGAKAARDIVSARALMSTDFTNWVKSAPKSNDPSAINRHMAQLANIAAKNPAISGDIQALQQALGKVANDNVGRSAIASDDKKE